METDKPYDSFTSDEFFQNLIRTRGDELSANPDSKTSLSSMFATIHDSTIMTEMEKHAREADQQRQRLRMQVEGCARIFRLQVKTDDKQISLQGRMIPTRCLFPTIFPGNYAQIFELALKLINLVDLKNEPYKLHGFATIDNAFFKIVQRPQPHCKCCQEHDENARSALREMERFLGVEVNDEEEEEILPF